VNGSVNNHFLARRGRRRNPLQFFYDCIVLADIIRFAPDILLIEGVDSPYFILFYPVMKLFGAHLVFLIHDVVPHTGSEMPILDRLTRLAVELSDSFIVFSEDQLKLFASQYGKTAFVLHLAQSTYYEEYYKEHSIEREPWTVLFFGTVRPNKGLEVLIQAAELARDLIPTLKVIVAGESDEFRQYSKHIMTPSMYELHLRRIPDNEVGSYFLRSQCSIFPYHDATQSGPLLLSLAFNCPVIAANVGGLAEYFTDGVNGLLFEKGNVRELAETIVKLLNDRPLLTKMQDQARTVFMDRFSPQVIAQELIDIVKKLETS
jgi:glycosyltransferase involved in cell wall biosynthesis